MMCLVSLGIFYQCAGFHLPLDNKCEALKLQNKRLFQKDRTLDNLRVIDLQ